MADLPIVIDFPPPVISTVSINCVGTQLMASQSSLTTGTLGAWPSANLAIFIPFKIATIFTAVKMFWITGTSGTDSVDIGIYDSQGNRMVSMGSTATSGTAVIQSVDITDTTLDPGSYYLALAVNGTTNTIGRNNNAYGVWAAMGIQSMASAFPLPATATFAAYNTAYIPFIAATSQTVI